MDYYFIFPGILIQQTAYVLVIRLNPGVYPDPEERKEEPIRPAHLLKLQHKIQQLQIKMEKAAVAIRIRQRAGKPISVHRGISRRVSIAAASLCEINHIFACNIP